MYTLYRITNTINDKVYIGQTRQTLNKRWIGHKSAVRGNSQQAIYCAMRKHGIENFSINAIDYVKTAEEADEREAELIIENNSLVTQNGYNIKEGGGNSPFCISPPKTDEHKQKLSIAHRKNAKPIVQFDWKTAEVIQVWESAKALHKTGYGRANVIVHCKSEKGYGYIYDSGWTYLSHWNSVEDKSTFADPNASPHNGTRVLCWTKAGEFVKEYSSLREAARALNLKSPTAIGNCLKGRPKSAAGFMWSYAGEDSVESYSGGCEKKVLCYNKLMKLVKEYDSVSTAANDVGVNIASISGALHGHQKTSAGFIWRFKE